MSGVKVEKGKADWIVVSYHGKNQFAATEAEARQLYAKLGEVLGRHKCDCDPIHNHACVFWREKP